MKARGDFTALLDDRVLAYWKAQPTRRRGHPRVYSDVAMLAVVTLKFAFSLPNRQCEGFVESLLRSLGRGDLAVPDHTSISRFMPPGRLRRMDHTLALTYYAKAKVRATFNAAAFKRPNSTPCIAIDSTGLACSGPYSHREHKWGAEPAMRRWRKVHISTDPRNGEITALEVTDSLIASGQEGGYR